MNDLLLPFSKFSFNVYLNITHQSIRVDIHIFPSVVHIDLHSGICTLIYSLRHVCPLDNDRHTMDQSIPVHKYIRQKCDDIFHHLHNDMVPNNSNHIDRFDIPFHIDRLDSPLYICTTRQIDHKYCRVRNCIDVNNFVPNNLPDILISVWKINEFWIIFIFRSLWCDMKYDKIMLKNSLISHAGPKKPESHLHRSGPTQTPCLHSVQTGLHALPALFLA